MGLTHPADLDSWRRWQRRRQPIRNLVHAVVDRGNVDSPAFVARNSTEAPRLVVILESRAASSRLAVLAPLAHLTDVSTAVVAPFDPASLLGEGWSVQARPGFVPAQDFPDVAVVLSAAHYLELGSVAYQDAATRGHSYVTVQHGLLTPAAPPLPPEAELLAWSQADSSFWASGRKDVRATIVGSQLLWAAASRPATHISRFATPTFLGQLHGMELPRSTLARAAITFCLQEGANYRPHPAEGDRRSVITHRAMEKLGIHIDRRRIPLTDFSDPIVSAFSTGVLEAAAQGHPAWVYYPHPPRWLREFWARYSMSRWGESPTEAPPIPDQEPAALVAASVRDRL